MKKLRILIDLDDTMEDFLPRWIQSVNYKYGKNATLDDVTSWHMNSVYPDLEEEELMDPLLEIEFWNGIKAKDGAQEYIRRLIDDGHHINVVTSSHYATLDTKMDYMFFRLFPFLTWSSVIVTSDKGRIKGDVLIDDNPDFMKDFTGLKLLMDAPHNKNRTGLSQMTRVYNWPEIYDIVTSYAEASE